MIVAASRTEQLDALQEALNFTPDDLAANRRGEYSDRQRAELERWIARSKVTSPGCARVSILVLLVILVGGLVILNNLLDGALLTFMQRSDAQFVGGVVVVFVALYLIWANRTVQKRRESVSDLSKLTLESVAGPIQIKYGHFYIRKDQAPTQLRLFPKPWYTERRRYYRVVVEDRSFSMEEKDARLFVEGASYRFYFVRFTTMIDFLLSVDAL